MEKCCHAKLDFAVHWIRAASVLAQTADMHTARRPYTYEILGRQI